jgi:hypothetical protein
MVCVVLRPEQKGGEHRADQKSLEGAGTDKLPTVGFIQSHGSQLRGTNRW